MKQAAAQADKVLGVDERRRTRLEVADGDNTAADGS